jgi:UDP-N-acetylmuramyl pentapeptide phosphotransferase/UDP-N-acetylglucosamine-1-phosphate transferase
LIGDELLHTSPFATPLTVAAVLAGAALSALGCRAMAAFARRRHLLDHPNERSLHQAPVPRLGGAAIVVASWLPVALGCALSSRRDPAVVAWLVASLLVAVLGLVDDLKPLRASVRFLVQIGASATFCVAAGVPTRIGITRALDLDLPYPVALVLCTVWLVGVLNIFNFMDGMDGLAGTQALTAGVAVAGALDGRPELAWIGVAVAAASAGFLSYNAPPAKIFMGDAGSTFLGFTLASFLVLGSDAAPPLPIAVAPLALAPFLLDGTFTIFRRLRRGEKVWQAHRSHLYQRAVQTGLSHKQVLVPYAVWCAAAAACAIVAARGDLVALSATVVVMLGALVATWRWVLRREALPTAPPLT